MLAEERRNRVARIVSERGSVSLTELAELLGASESTLRRDIQALDDAGILRRVHGGATAAGARLITSDVLSSERSSISPREKVVIGAYAASLVEADDFVYIDAGTTTAQLVESLSERDAIYMTNSLAHASRLLARGMRTFVLGGEVKAATDAIIGEMAVAELSRYHFTKGFFGTNGATPEAGLTTPDPAEAAVKHAAMAQCRHAYVLCDSTKLGQTSLVSFAAIDEAVLICDQIPMELRPQLDAAGVQMTEVDA